MEFFQYHNGAICYVNLKNFMGHREFMWQPGPKFNLITGQVESGKTTILQAIRIGLGIKNSFMYYDNFLEIWVSSIV